MAVTLSATRPAAAVPAGWATFSAPTGTARDFTFTLQQRAVGFPVATVVSDSATAAVPSGDTSFLSPQTPPAAVYGSSRGSGYVQLRPTSTNAAPPSTTTYTFDRPTPAAGWAFVLGDIDSDQVSITATDASGATVAVSDLGFRGTFNYCAPGVTPKPSCTGVITDGSDKPSWNPDRGVLKGNPTATDSAGASAWFEPTTSLSSLTFVFAQRLGSPTYQTWFTAAQHDLSGTVSAPPGQAAGLVVKLFDPSGAPVATTTTAADGSYAFPGLATYDHYRVELTRPDGLTSDDPLTKTADLSSRDAVVDFALRTIVPAPVSGTVRDTDGKPLDGVLVTLTPDTGDPVSVRTGSDGTYLFDRVDGGTYTLSSTPPDDYTVDSGPGPITVPPDSETPFTDRDFVLRPAPTGSLAGAVRDDAGQPRDGVIITVTGPDGAERSLRTRPDGTYQFDGLAVGTYIIAVTPPPGFRTTSSASRSATIPDDGGDITDQDFALAAVPAGSVSGQVEIDGEPAVTPVPVAVTGGPDHSVDRVVTTDPDTGRFTADDLLPGTYDLTVLPPTGTEIDGTASRRVVIDDQGDDVTGVSFALHTTAVPTTRPSASSSPTSTPTSSRPTTTPTAPASTTPATASASGRPASLPATGGTTVTTAILGLVAVLLGAVTLWLRRPTRSR